MHRLLFLPTHWLSQSFMLLMTVIAPLVFLWTASSAVALSFGAGSLVSVLQNWLLARDARAEREKV